jgi:hypothetical protein
MESIPVHLFKASFRPFLALLNEHNLKYSIPAQRSAIPMASSAVIEILLSPYMWGALSTVIVAFLKYRNSRKVIITTRDGQIIQAEGLNSEELKHLLKQAESVAVIETTAGEE